MIGELVLFRVPAGWDRDQVLADARPTVERWRANPELIRKHYILGEDGACGAFYLWKSREAAERGHDAAWRQAVERRTGAPPTITYFDVFMLLDNEHGRVVENP